MPETAAPPPPPSSPTPAYSAPPASYPPVQAYSMSPSAPPSSSSGVKLPAWLDLWTLLELLIILVGAIFILVGFLFGDAAASQVNTGGSLSTYQSDLEAFFAWAGVGIFLVILGWLLRVVLTMWRGSKAAAPGTPTTTSGTSAVSPPAPAAGAPSPPPMAPVAVPASPACPNCGKPTTYIAQYGRYYCYSCARYV